MMNYIVSLQFEGNYTTNSENNESGEENTPTKNYYGYQREPPCCDDSYIPVPGMDPDIFNKSEISMEVTINYRKLTYHMDNNICNVKNIDKGKSSLCSIHNLQQEQDLCRQIIHRGTVRVVDGIQWKDDLLFKNSTEFLHLRDLFTELFDNYFSESESYDGVVIEGFRKGSVVVNFAIVWNTNTTSDMDEETLNRLLLEALINSSGEYNYTMDMNNTNIDGKRSQHRFQQTQNRSCMCFTLHWFHNALVQPRTDKQQITLTFFGHYFGHINVSRFPSQP